MPTAGDFKKRKKYSDSDRLNVITVPSRSREVEKTKTKKVKFLQKFVQIFSKNRKKTKRKTEDFYDGLEIPFALEFYRRQYQHQLDTLNFDGNEKNIGKVGDFPSHEFHDEHLRRGRRGTYLYDADPKRKRTMVTSVQAEPDLSGGDEIERKRKHSLKNVSAQRIGIRRKSLLAQKSNAQETKFRGRPATKVHIPWAALWISGTAAMVAVEVLTCVLIYMYYLFLTYTFTFDPGNNYFEVFLLCCDFYFLFEAILRLITEAWRHFSDVDYTVLLIPCTVNMWILSIISLLPLEYFYALGLIIAQDDSIYDVFRSDLFKLNRLIYLIRVYIFFGIC